jgi:hypothetical protein
MDQVHPFTRQEIEMQTSTESPDVPALRQFEFSIDGIFGADHLSSEHGYFLPFVNSGWARPIRPALPGRPTSAKFGGFQQTQSILCPQ